MFFSAFLKKQTPKQNTKPQGGLLAGLYLKNTERQKKTVPQAVTCIHIGNDVKSQLLWKIENCLKTRIYDSFKVCASLVTYIYLACYGLCRVQGLDWTTKSDSVCTQLVRYVCTYLRYITVSKNVYCLMQFYGRLSEVVAIGQERSRPSTMLRLVLAHCSSCDAHAGGAARTCTICILYTIRSSSRHNHSSPTSTW